MKGFENIPVANIIQPRGTALIKNNDRMAELERLAAEKGNQYAQVEQQFSSSQTELARLAQEAAAYKARYEAVLKAVNEMALAVNAKIQATGGALNANTIIAIMGEAINKIKTVANG